MDQKRNTYQEKAQETLDEILGGIARLEEEARDVSRDFSDAVERNIQQLRAECERLRLKLGGLVSTSGEPWEEIRDGFEQAGASLRKAWSKYAGK